MPDTILIRFTRKPLTLRDVLVEMRKSDAYSHEAVIAEYQQLTTEEYDDFTDSFLADHDWLAGKGGFKNDIRQVIAVSAVGRETLYVDPSGHSYARYVGMEAPTDSKSLPNIQL